MTAQSRRTTITAIIRDMGRATYGDIKKRGGTNLASPLMEMVQEGKLIRRDGYFLINPEAD